MKHWKELEVGKETREEIDHVLVKENSFRYFLNEKNAQFWAFIQVQI